MGRVKGSTKYLFSLFPNKFIIVFQSALKKRLEAKEN